MSRPATSRLKVNPVLGSLPVLQYCTPAQLRIDDAYQRSLDAGSSQSLIRRIAMFWNWDLCQPLVVARRDDGGLYVVDGQHRLAAARLRGDIAQLPCVVSQYASAADEAASFVALNQQRRPLTALDLFKAALAAEDETAVTVTTIMAEMGLSLASHSNYTAWKPGQVSNIGGIVNCYRQYGEGIARASLMNLAAAFPGEVLRYSGTIFPGIVGVLSKDRTVSHAGLIDVLKKQSQGMWRRAILRRRAENPNEKFQLAAGNVFREALGQRLGVDALPSQAPRPAPPPPVPSIPVATGHRSWCQQCDRNIDHAAAAICRSPFCSLKKRA